MTIDFEKIPVKVIPAFKGGEGEAHLRMADDGVNKIMRGMLPPGSSIGMHRHDTSSEIIYILSGTGTVVTNDGLETVLSGQVHYCRKGEAHSLQNRADSPLEFYAVVPEQ